MILSLTFRLIVCLLALDEHISGNGPHSGSENAAKSGTSEMAAESVPSHHAEQSSGYEEAREPKGDFFASDKV